MNGWTGDRAGGGRDDISAKSLRGQSTHWPLHAGPALLHLSLVATVAAPSLYAAYTRYCLGLTVIRWRPGVFLTLSSIFPHLFVMLPSRHTTAFCSSFHLLFDLLSPLCRNIQGPVIHDLLVPQCFSHIFTLVYTPAPSTMNELEGYEFKTKKSA